MSEKSVARRLQDLSGRSYQHCLNRIRNLRAEYQPEFGPFFVWLNKRVEEIAREWSRA